jgi:hypothetical protein
MMMAAVPLTAVVLLLPPFPAASVRHGASRGFGARRRGGTGVAGRNVHGACFYDQKGALDWIKMHVAMRAAFNKISLPQALIGKMRALPLLDGIAESTLDRSTCRPSLAHVDLIHPPTFSTHWPLL